MLVLNHITREKSLILSNVFNLFNSLNKSTKLNIMSCNVSHHFI